MTGKCTYLPPCYHAIKPRANYPPAVFISSYICSYASSNTDTNVASFTLVTSDSPAMNARFRAKVGRREQFPKSLRCRTDNPFAVDEGSPGLRIIAIESEHFVPSKCRVDEGLALPRTRSPVATAGDAETNPSPSSHSGSQAYNPSHSNTRSLYLWQRAKIGRTFGLLLSCHQGVVSTEILCTEEESPPSSSSSSSSDSLPVVVTCIVALAAASNSAFFCCCCGVPLFPLVALPTKVSFECQCVLRTPMPPVPSMSKYPHRDERNYGHLPKRRWV
jgi:hypothetical protein